MCREPWSLSFYPRSDLDLPLTYCTESQIKATLNRKQWVIPRGHSSGEGMRVLAALEPVTESKLVLLAV